MQGNIISFLNYTGEVKISVNSNGKTYNVNFHNAGTDVLTNAIVKALAGEDISNQLPKYLNFVYTNGDKTGVLIRRPVPFTGIIWKEATDTESSYLYLSATIVASDKQSTIITSNTIASLHMQTLYGETLATIDDPNLVKFYEMLDEGTDILIEWKMYINK